MPGPGSSLSHPHPWLETPTIPGQIPCLDPLLACGVMVISAALCFNFLWVPKLVYHNNLQEKSHWERERGLAFSSLPIQAQQSDHPTESTKACLVVPHTPLLSSIQNNNKNPKIKMAVGPALTFHYQIQNIENWKKLGPQSNGLHTTHIHPYSGIHLFLFIFFLKRWRQILTFFNRNKSPSAPLFFLYPILF